MSTKDKNRVCPVENAGGLDNSIRKFLQNPVKILKPFVTKGMTVLDLGCGPGLFTIEIAKLLDGSGKVIAADLQDGMLEKVKQKIRGTELEQIVEIRKCSETSICVSEKADLILAFYMIHEVPDKDRLFKELKSILNPGGKILIIEPKFHVTKEAFDDMINKLENSGFKTAIGPKVFFSRSALMTII